MVQDTELTAALLRQHMEDNAMDKDKIRKGVRLILEGVGEDITREGLVETPNRIASMYEELAAGYTDDAAKHLQTKFHVEDNDMVMEKDIHFYSFCEHHMLPFYGTAAVAYIPDGEIVGLSKIARIADMAAKRLQLQERIGSDIAEIMAEVTGSDSIAVKIEGCHSCMTARGIKKTAAKTLTTTFTGRFKTDASRQMRVMMQ